MLWFIGLPVLCVCISRSLKFGGGEKNETKFGRSIKGTLLKFTPFPVGGAWGRANMWHFNYMYN